MTRKTKPATKPALRNVVPDKLDLRDRLYLPAVAVPPAALLVPKRELPVLHQGDTNACTGFALATVIHALRRRRALECKDTETRGDKSRGERVSPFMLYSMARRYDEFPGAKADTGSSLRGAMKAWFRHGVCAEALWKNIDMPGPTSDPGSDWWLDAARRPLGAYYRVDTRSSADMHVALNEVSALYASADTHDGWEDLAPATKSGGFPVIKYSGRAGAGGHAFAIIGYTRDGFIVQNSWGKQWGRGGHAILTYDDWMDNAMDCWVAQLGVPTQFHEEVAKSSTLRVVGGTVQVASDAALRVREISPFVIDMGNDGALSSTGRFRTQPGDVEALVDIHLRIARKRWGLKANEPVNVAIYAHGGLTDETTAAATAARWIPALYDRHVFPVFLMWETDVVSTLTNCAKDLLKGEPVGGLRERLGKWWDARIERLVSAPGSKIWGQMKQNGEQISANPDSGGMLLAREFDRAQTKEKIPVRLHLVGHSAGAIVHSHVAAALAKAGWTIASMNLMAPAVRVDTFNETAAPLLRSGKIERLLCLNLTDLVEQHDTTCRAVLGYSRSLLYLVSEALEYGTRAPILGMAKYFDGANLKGAEKRIRLELAPGSATAATTHGGFDEDDATMKTVIAHILGSAA